MNALREARSRLLRHVFTGAFLVCAGGFAVGAGFAAEPPVRYGFEEGEPLFYKMHVAVSNESAADLQFYDSKEKSRHNGQADFDIDFQLMPISCRNDGAWKVRLVLDNVKQTTRSDGDIRQQSLDRRALRRHEFNPLEFLRIKLADFGSRRPIDDEAANLPPSQPPALQPRAPEDLFDQPILMWIAPEGTVKGFEDRGELQRVVEGLNFKECLELTLPPLVVPALYEGAGWSREVPVDLPAPLLGGSETRPMALKLSYRVAGLENRQGHACARIVLEGQFALDGLRLPIHKEERHYLIWTTFLTAINDQVEGEFLFDLEQRVVRSAQIRSIYRYSTLQGRKADKYRSRVVAENIVRTRISNELTTVPQAAQVPTRNPQSLIQ